MKDEITEARLRNKKIRKSSYENLFMNLEDLRFATNEEVAKYRAERLKCDTLVEIGSGIGLQTIEFSKQCKKVYAIEIDERKIEFAKKNAKQLELKNITFIHGDALKVVDKIKKADIVFCETARSPQAKERRIEDLSPDIFKLLETYGKLTDKICIEIPPQMKKIELDCEKEYLSVDNKLNRLNLYFGRLKKCDKSVVALPSKERIEASGEIANRSRILKYFYEADKALLKAEMMNELALKTDTFIYNETLLTSRKRVKSSFFRNSFLLLGNAKKFSEALAKLKQENCGKVILRQNISPESYWKERKKYEDKLKGRKTLYLFVSQNNYLIAKKL